MRYDNPDTRLLAALASDPRLAIVQQIAAAGEMNAKEVQEATGGSQSVVCRNLQILEREGIVDRERRGKEVQYIVNPEVVDRLHSIADRIQKTMEENS